jgi:hypothetical protein
MRDERRWNGRNRAQQAGRNLHDGSGHVLHPNGTTAYRLGQCDDL